MARRRIFWHIGPDDVGAAWIGTALDASRAALAEAGVHVAGTAPERERVTAELRGTAHDLGLRCRDVEGASARLVHELWKHRGTTIVSLPGLAGATPEQVAMAMDGTRGAEHHVVLVERDLTSQLYAGAQASLERGTSTRADQYVARALEEADGVGDLPGILGRWTRLVFPENVHVVAEASPDLIWKRLVGLLGADLPLPEGAVRSDLGPSQLTVLREVVIGLEGRLSEAERRTTLRDWLSRAVLARQPGGGFDRLPGALDDSLRARAAEWTDFCHREGYDVQGTLRTDREDGGRRPISSQESASAALAEALVEVARLREQNADLEARNEHLDKKRRKHKTRAKKLAERLDDHR
ncbi:hypothetical protein GCM10011519_19520 [Marmoricola endophyticus]|uniref:Uncharacterized protein n=1 Tax=Marmoricola endophyticus TaxID=2040280 RepID=A0A917F303_9ACTN|nr:hypothetical protein [Marmoricola endophyticus]GGF45717.1 hypothetical protein GCM10011519_19520 [Marmoricola endophyticus]